MIEAIIIDDEHKLRQVLSIKLSQFCPDVRVLGQAANADEAFEIIGKLKPNLIFLDIAMPNKSGFDLINMFDTIDFEIIFVTGFNEYALDALKVSAVDFILKPVKTDSLVEAVSKAKMKLETKSALEKYKNLKHNLKHLGDQNAKIAIPGSSMYEFVLLGDIIRCEGWQKYTKVHLKSGNVIVSSYNLGVFRDMLESYDFFSTHKSHLINKNHVVRYLKEGEVILSDDSSVPVARRRKDDFMEEVVKYISI